MIKNYTLGGFVRSLNSILPQLISLIVFWIYGGLGGIVSTPMVFSLLSIFNSISIPMEGLMFFFRN